MQPSTFLKNIFSYFYYFYFHMRLNKRKKKNSVMSLMLRYSDIHRYLEPLSCKNVHKVCPAQVNLIDQRNYIISTSANAAKVP